MAYNLQSIYILSGFANYFDRKIRYFSTLAEYLSAASDYELKEDINFNPADGVETVLDVLTDAGDTFQYLLVVDPADNSIVSRWYIMDANRNLAGQYRMRLRRDVVAESINNETFQYTAPIYVEKGILPNEDPMIVNKEGMTFNQIKKSETVLTDPTGWGYIVGYMANSATIAARTLTISSTTPADYEDASTLSGGSLIDPTDITNLISGTPLTIAVGNISLVFGIKELYISNRRIQFVIPNELNLYSYMYSYSNAAAWSHAIGNSTDTFIQTPLNKMNDFIVNQGSSNLKSALTDVIDNDIPTEKFYNNTNLSKLLLYEGKILRSSGQYYIMHFSLSSVSDHSEVVISKSENTYFDNFVSSAQLAEQFNDWELYLNYKIQTVSLELIPYEIGSCEYSIPNSHNTLKDAPYSMFVIPYTNELGFRAGPNLPFAGPTMVNKEQALMIAADIAEQLGDQLYDIQLLPYIPDFQDWIQRWNNSAYPNIKYWINITDKTVNVDYAEINTATTPPDTIGLILFPQRSNSSYTIQKEFYANSNWKIESECNFYRLCSPNYNGVFEFNLAKNGGSVIYFNVDITYKPINPFIRITPQFKGLYGQTFQDGRGLVLGGDFSLPIIKDAWITYQQNNKNYATMFARDIQNLDVSQKQERIKENISLGAGIVGGGAGGAVAGAKLGGGYGAIAGAAAGTAIGAVGAAIDARLGQERRAEAKDYAIDRFNMNLANIKAIPDSLAKNSAFTIINKIFPFVEYYTCTDEEKEALRRKITYDGMTVGRIDYISNFMGGEYQQKYFKGQLIRALGINEDNHYLNALYEEIAKGVYI